jgi:hypothetical protein
MILKMIKMIMLPTSSILYWNCNGLLSKQDDLIAIINSTAPANSPAVIALVETHVDPKKENKIKKLPGYIIISSSYTSKSGGTIIYIRSNIPNNHIQTLPTLHIQFAPSSIHWVELKLPTSILLAIVYIHSGFTAEGMDQLKRSIKQANNLNKPIFLLGDFNMHHTHWYSDKVSARAEDFVQFITIDQQCDILNPHYIPGIPTFHRKPDYESIIDLAITNAPELVLTLKIPNSLEYPLHKLSDHEPLLLMIHNKNLEVLPPAAPLPSDKELRISWNLKDPDWSEFQSLLCQTLKIIPTICGLEAHNITQSEAQQRIEQYWQLLKAAIISAADSIIGRKQLIRRKLNSWFSHPDVHLVYNAFKRGQNQYRRDKHMNVRMQYHAARKLWMRTVRTAKQWSWTKFVKQVEKGDTELNWNAFKRTMPTESTTSLNSIADSNGNLPTGITDSLNNLAAAYNKSAIPPAADPHIERVVQEKVRNLINNRYDSVTKTQKQLQEYPLLDRPFSLKEIRTQLKYQHTDSAPGPDNILPLFLKHGGIELHQHLTTLFNYSWSHSVLPQDWTDSYVVSLYKGKGARNLATNYRPLSMTSIVVRTMEHLIHHRLSPFIENSRLLSNYQFGFRAGRSTFDAIYQLKSRIQRFFRTCNHRIRNTKTTALPVAFLDLKKAFDCCWRDGILYHLNESAKVDSNCWFWIRSFLSNRRFRTIYQNDASDWHDSIDGVPQGAVLSPLLFAIYINHIMKYINEQQSECEAISQRNGIELDYSIMNVLAFADDLCVYPQCTEDPGWFIMFQYGLHALSKWSREWRMAFSTDKSQLIWFSRDSDTKNIMGQWRGKFKLCGNILQVVGSYKYLGVWFQSNLKWDIHCNYIINRARSDSHLVCRLISRTWSPSFTTVRTLVQSFLRPRCTYGLAFIQPTTTWLNQIDTLLIRPIRMVLGLMRNAHKLSLFAEANIPTLSYYRSLAVLQFAHRAESLPKHHPTFITYSCQLIEILLRTANFITTPIAVYAQSLAVTVRNIESQWQIKATNKMSDIKKAMITNFIDHWRSHPPDVAKQYGAVLKVVKPTCDRSPYLKVDGTTIMKLRSKFRFRRTLLNASRSRFNPTIISTCPHCPGIPETDQHVLLACPKYSTARNVAQLSLSTLEIPVKTLTYNEILGIWPLDIRYENEKQKIEHYGQVLQISGKLLLDINKDRKI